MQMRSFLTGASVMLAATGCCGVGYDAHCLQTTSLETPLEEELPLPPLPRFHPAPTRPVFSPVIYAESPHLESLPPAAPLLKSPLLEIPPPAPVMEQIGPVAPEGIPARILPPPDAELLPPPVELLDPPDEYRHESPQHEHGDSTKKNTAPRTAAFQETGRSWLRR